MDDPNSTETVKVFWENAYRQNISKLIGVGYRYTVDRQVAEDLAQDTFIIAYQKKESFKGTGPFEAWLRRIMVNVCLQYLRVQHKKKYLDDWLKNETSAVETHEENINGPNSEFTETVLLEAVNRLPEHHKLVFNLYVLDQFTHAQIGKELGISEGTSKSHLARARKKIKELLNEKPGIEKKGKKKAAFLLFIWNIDGLYKKRFKNFGLTNRKNFSFDSLHAQPVTAPITSASISILKKFSVLRMASIIIVTVTIATTAYLQFFKSRDVYPLNKTSILKNDGIVNPKEGLNNNANADSHPMNQASFISGGHRTDNDSNVGINAKRNGSIIASPDVTGTFFAEKLFWSAEDNQLYFQGKTNIIFGEKKYVSDSSASFLGKVYYLVLDGKIVKLEREAKQDIKLSGKKYKLTQLSPNSAVRKYGEKGRKGAIEISLADL
jgi:RNA polymerase sigma factor (sigma-70 family)